MNDLVAVVAAVLAAFGVAAAARLRRRTPAPTQGGWQVPTQLDRRDFTRPDAPWIVVAFTSATCSTCADVAAKAAVLASDTVAVERVDYTERRDLHERYRIDAVPSVVVAGADGAVCASFIGPVKAQDLWAAVANCREPGSAPVGCADHGA